MPTVVCTRRVIPNHVRCTRPFPHLDEHAKCTIQFYWYLAIAKVATLNNACLQISCTFGDLCEPIKLDVIDIIISSSAFSTRVPSVHHASDAPRPSRFYPWVWHLLDRSRGHMPCWRTPCAPSRTRRLLKVSLETPSGSLGD